VEVVFEAAEMGGIQFHPPNQTSDVTASIEVQTVEIFQRKIVRMDVDSHGDPSNYKIFEP
jgi:hypothetical protein